MLERNQHLLSPSTRGPLKWAKEIRVEHRQHLLQTPPSQSVRDNVCQGAAAMATSKGPTQ